MEEQNTSNTYYGTSADDIKVYTEKLRLEQNLLLGASVSAAAALVGSILWATVTVLTQHQIGYMAIAIGFMVGYVNRYFGKGIDQIFGIMGGAFALLGCVFGNILSLIAFSAQQENMEFFALLTSINWAVLPEVMIETFQVMDLLFYALAVYEGYKFSFRIITEDEISKNAS